MMNDWESFGAVLAILSAIVSNLGVNIQKYSHSNEAKVPEHEQRPYIQRPVWWVGLLLVITGSLGDFSAFGFATQSLVAALGGGSTLVANVLTAHYLNKESLYKTDIAGVIFVIIGVVIISWIAEPNVEYPLPELEKRFVRTEFVIYIVIVVLCTVSMLATIKGSMANRLKNQVYWSKRRQKQLMKQFEVRIQRVERRITALEEELIEVRGNYKGSKASFDIRAREQLAVEQVEDIVDGVVCPDRAPYYYAICSGIVGAITVLLAKCSAVMIALSLKGKNQFKYGLTYVFIGGMFVCILVQTHLLNMATSFGDIMIVFPIFQAFWIIFSVIGGAVFYESEKDFTVEKWVLYPMAMISIAAGVLLLVQHGSREARTEKIKNDFDVDDSIDMMADASMISPLLPPESKGYLEAL